jgi:hypothetical protein
MDAKLVARKAEVVSRIMETVSEYYGAFGTPIGVSILSAKYSRALILFGGFPRVLNEMKEQGLVQITLRSTGGKDVYPGGISIQVETDTRLL